MGTRRRLRGFDIPGEPLRGPSREEPQGLSDPNPAPWSRLALKKTADEVDSIEGGTG